ncbi:hypothetical protein I8Y06_003282 [Photobacterium damselae]|nr:hypothetical protein [Photobacterium damselae]
MTDNELYFFNAILLPALRNYKEMAKANNLVLDLNVEGNTINMSLSETNTKLTSELDDQRQADIELLLSSQSQLKRTRH